MPGKILIVEDHLVIGIDLAQTVEELGFKAIGPVSTVSQSLAILDQEPVAMAILDLNLGSELSTPVALACRRLGIPFVVATDYEKADAIGGEVFKGAINIGRPFERERILPAFREAAARMPTRPEASC
jgi:two-component system, response regulator PdtaR